MSTLSFAAVGDIAFEGLCFDRPSANVFLSPFEVTLDGQEL